MPLRISQDTRNQIIRKWIGGKSRDEIAELFNVSSGTVSNVVDEWRNDLGFPTADSIRQLSVEIRRCAISVPECAQGIRILNTLHLLGIPEDHFRQLYFRDLQPVQIL